MNIISTTVGPIAAIRQDGAAPLHLMMHGLRGSKELYSTLSKESLLNGRAVIAPDFPGFGESPPARESLSTLDSFAALMEELVRSLGHTEVVLIGHSLGGMVGTKLLSSKILKVRALISLEGNLTLEDCGASRDIASLSAQKFTTALFPKMLKELDSSTEPGAHSRLEALRQVDPLVLYRSACLVVEECKSGELFRAFNHASVPCLLLVGEKSAFATRQAKGKARVVTVPNAKHFLLQDNYPFVLSQITQFLGAIDGQ